MTKKNSDSAEENQTKIVKKKDGRRAPPHAFKPGQSGNPAGRAKGSRNKFSQAFIDDVYKDWLENGIAVLKKVREDEPAAYLRVAASLVPREFNLKDNSDAAIDAMLDKLNDEELDNLITGLTAIGRKQNSSQNKQTQRQAENRSKSDSIH